MNLLDARPGTLKWEDICRDPSLNDLPYKVETNDRGQVVMSPTFRYHGRFAVIIASLLEEHLPDGVASVEAAIRTSKGTKVADAIWETAERYDLVKDSYDAPVAAEICVEVLSPSNTQVEIEEKKQLYLEAGAEEVWTCDADGGLQFFDKNGRLEASRRAPNFPSRITR